MADVVATILTLPDDGGSPIIRIDYRLDSGVAIDSGLTAPFTGPFTIIDGSNKNVQWRAVNVLDDNPNNWSDTKIIITAAPTLAASDSLTGRTLTVTVDSVTGEPAPTVTISGNVSFAGPNGGPWTYTAPSAGSDLTINWTVTASNVESPDATASGSEVIPADGDLNVENIGDEIVIFTDDAGNMTIEIEQGTYQGTYTTRHDGTPLTVAMVEAAPTCLLLPTISGPTTEGQTLTTQPGLWLYDGSDPGDQTWDWVNVTDGSTGVTDLDYLVRTDDVGDRMKVTETFGGISVDSLETDVIDTGVQPYPDEFVAGDWTLASGSTSLPNSLLIDIVNLPNDNGSPITVLAYDVDGDNVWRNLELTGIGSEEVQMEFPGIAYDIRLRASNGVGANLGGDTKSATSGAGVPSVPVDWDPATGSAFAQVDIVITTLPEDNGSVITDFEFEVDGDGMWTSLGENQVGTYPIAMPEAGVEYSFSLRGINAVGAGPAASPEVAESDEGSGFIDPEAGLIITNTWAEGQSITAGSFVAGEPSVWAADFIGLVAATGTGLELGGSTSSQGAGYHFTDVGSIFVIQCGQGASHESPTDRMATLVATGADMPTGDGTLVVEFVGSASGPTLPAIRAWWNGVEIAGTVHTSTVAENWSATSLGGWMNRSGIYPGDMWNAPMTYTAVSSLRQYNNQTVGL